MTARAITVGGLATVLVLMFSPTCPADQPKLGFSGTLVRLPRGYGELRGYRVDSVRRGSLAADMGLERGDIVAYIGETMAFTTEEAYLYALRQQGKSTKIGVLNVRNGRLVWCACRLGHNPEPHYAEDPPDGVVMVDFAHNMRMDE